MEVPSDYVLDMMHRAIDGRIDSMEKKMESNHIDVRNNINEIKTSFKEFQTKCNKDMGHYDARIKGLEEVKYKIYAFSGVIAAMSGFVWGWILKRFS